MNPQTQSAHSTRFSLATIIIAVASAALTLTLLRSCGDDDFFGRPTDAYPVLHR